MPARTQLCSFERCFAVPEGVDADKIEASFKKGVLTVTLPKKPEAFTAKLSRNTDGDTEQETRM
ncbi:MAG: Hsp20/alpha crystallin family protein [Xanthobacteraceae bacterium]